MGQLENVSNEFIGPSNRNFQVTRDGMGAKGNKKILKCVKVGSQKQQRDA